ncbi:hypothetical protein BZA70DRAFT_112560 [Myxozyma melibiosi]|uniref:Uncharacterized protein n=1 Tax=Myxozyma melibiosi TaxID=54550 RepID=A0ABR1FCE0_9ASCO
MPIKLKFATANKSAAHHPDNFDHPPADPVPLEPSDRGFSFEASPTDDNLQDHYASSSRLHSSAPSLRDSSSSTIPSSNGPLTPPLHHSQRADDVYSHPSLADNMRSADSNRNSQHFFDSVVFEPPQPSYLSQQDDIPIVSPPEAAAFVASRKRDSRDLVAAASPGMSPGFSPGLYGAASDDELLSNGFRSRKPSYFGGDSPSFENGFASATNSTDILNKRLQSPPAARQEASSSVADLTRGISSFQLEGDDDEGSLSDSSFTENNRSAEQTLTAMHPSYSPGKNPQIMLRTATASSMAESPTAASAASASTGVDVPIEAVEFMKRQHRRETEEPTIERTLKENRLMTVSEFENYRRAQAEAAMNNTNDEREDGASFYSDEDADEEEDHEGYLPTDAENEKKMVAQRLKQRQEANLAVYRQQMRKVTGQSSNLPLKSSSIDGSLSHGFGTFGSRTGSFSGDDDGGLNDDEGDDDDDEEIPLAILQAHGIPGRGRQPLSRPASAARIGSGQYGAPFGQNMMQAGAIPSYPRGMTLPEQLYDPAQDASMMHSANQSRGLIHEIQREQEAKIQRRTMLNMQMNGLGLQAQPMMERPISPYRQTPSAYMQPPPQQFQQPQYGYPGYPQPSPPLSVHPNQPQPNPADPTAALGPELQSQMQKLIQMQMQMQMQMMQQMIQASNPSYQPPPILQPVAPTNEFSPPQAPFLQQQQQRPASPAASLRTSNQQFAQPAANPARYRTLSTQLSSPNLSGLAEPTTAVPPVPHPLPQSPQPPQPPQQSQLLPPVEVGPPTSELAQASIEHAETASLAGDKVLKPSPLINNSAPELDMSRGDDEAEWARIRTRKASLRKLWEKKSGGAQNAEPVAAEIA